MYSDTYPRDYNILYGLLQQIIVSIVWQKFGLEFSEANLSTRRKRLRMRYCIIYKEIRYETGPVSAQVTRDDYVYNSRMISVQVSVRSSVTKKVEVYPCDIKITEKSCVVANYEYEKRKGEPVLINSGGIRSQMRYR